MNKRILPISNKPLLKCFAHSSYRCAIVQPYIENEYDAILDRLVFRNNDTESNEYRNDTNAQAESRIGKVYIKLKNADKQDDNIFLYNEGSDNIECSIGTEYFKWFGSWSLSGIRLTGHTKECFEEFRLGFLPNNKIAVEKIYGEGNKPDFRAFDNEKNYKYLKMVLKNRKIICYASYDADNWKLYYEIDNFISEDSYKLGYCLWLGEDNYRNWFFTNHILLHASPSMVSDYDLKLDYYTGSKILDRYDSFNSWIKTNYIDTAFIDRENILQMIKKAIDNGYCIELYINEKYIPETWAYNVQDYSHSNLVYGYDFENEKVYLAGFDKMQNYHLYSISAETFVKAFVYADDKHDILFMRYQPDCYTYSLNIDIIVRQLKEYLKSDSSFYREDLRINQSVRVYGLSIYDTLIKYKTKFRDKRLAYILYEHKLIMCMRVEYFFERQVIYEKDFMKLKEMISELVKLSHHLLMISIRYNLTKSDETLSEIEKELAMIKEKDLKFTRKLICALNNHQVVKV